MNFHCTFTLRKHIVIRLGDNSLSSRWLNGVALSIIATYYNRLFTLLSIRCIDTSKSIMMNIRDPKEILCCTLYITLSRIMNFYQTFHIFQISLPTAESMVGVHWDSIPEASPASPQLTSIRCLAHTTVSKRIDFWWVKRTITEFFVMPLLRQKP